MKKAWLLYLVILMIGGILFIPFLGAVHLFDWDEINFAESAREMIVTGDYFRVQVDYQPFWQKPPLFIWMQTLSMKLFGVNEFAARLPNAIMGITTLVVVFTIGCRLFSTRFGVFWALAWIGSLLPHFYFKSGIIDPTFNLFIFLGIYFIAKLSLFPLEPPTKNRLLNVALAGLFIGLATLTKGPVALLIFGLAVLIFWLLHFRERLLGLGDIALFTLVFLIATFAWYGVETVQHGTWFLERFILYQIELFNTQSAGHGGPFYYHAIVLLLGCFPASIIMLRAFRRNANDPVEQYRFHQWMLILFWVVLVIFSIVKTKIIHYSSLTYFPITFMAAYVVEKYRHEVYQWRWYNTAGLFVVGGLLATAFILLPIFGANIDVLAENIRDRFARANLQAEVRWTGWEALIGIFYLVFIFIGYYLIKRYMVVAGVMALFVSTAIIIQLALLIIVPKIEGYTQRAAIEFYEGLQEEDAYIEVLGFKSFAHLFYSRKKPVVNEKSYDKEWLLKGDIDKVAYFVCKNIHADRYRNLPDMQEIYSKNGFVFFRRKPK